MTLTPHYESGSDYNPTTKKPFPYWRQKANTSCTISDGLWTEAQPDYRLSMPRVSIFKPKKNSDVQETSLLNNVRVATGFTLTGQDRVPDSSTTSLVQWSTPTQWREMYNDNFSYLYLPGSSATFRSGFIAQQQQVTAFNGGAVLGVLGGLCVWFIFALYDACVNTYQTVRTKRHRAGEASLGVSGVTEGVRGDLDKKVDT